MTRFIPLLLFVLASKLAIAADPEDIVRSLYVSDIQQADETRPTIKVEIEVEEIELNNKPPKEILARLMHPDFCGTKGCTTVVLRKNKNAWQEVISSLITHGNFEVTKEHNKGYYSIKFTENKTWIFNGSTYE